MTLCRSDLALVKWWLGSTFKEPSKTGLIKPMYSCFEKSQSEAEPNIYKSQVIRKYFHSLRGWIQWKRESLGDRATQDLGVVLPGGETRARGAPQLFRRHLKPQKLHRDQNNPLQTFFPCLYYPKPKTKAYICTINHSHHDQIRSDVNWVLCFCIAEQLVLLPRPLVGRQVLAEVSLVCQQFV